jgi:hypothetical protein
MKKNQLLVLIIFLMLSAVSIFIFGKYIAKAANDPWITINKNAGSTQVREVTLYFSGPAGTTEMLVSNFDSFSGAKWEKYEATKQWYLEIGNGVKNVYVKYKDNKGFITKPYFDNIALSVPQSMDVDFKINDGAEKTDSRYVSLSFTYSTGVEFYGISNSSNAESVDMQKIQSGTQWVLDSGSGTKTIYVVFKDGNGTTKTISKSIVLNESDRQFKEGDLIKSKTSSIYYVGADGKIHPFLDLSVYHSWYDNFENIQVVSTAKIGEYIIGAPVCVRQGTWLLKFNSVPKIYSVEPGCRIRPMRSESEAAILYGPTWRQRILELDFYQSSFYSVVGYSAADPNKDIIDSDNDGVDRAAEIKYHSLDSKEDTDNDGLSDYEEINYWFSDPTKSDTDADGYADGSEVQGGFSPVGTGRIDNVPDNTYKYPAGHYGISDLFESQGDYSLPSETISGSYSSSKPSIIKNGEVINL